MRAFADEPQARCPYAVLRVALRFGPDVETTKFCNATGLDANNVNAALVRTRRAGRVKIVSKRSSRVRRVVVTHAGHDFPSEREDALLVKGHMKKPSAAYQGEAKKRGCLKCRKEFHSSWPGGCVCAQCKETVEWREPIAAQTYLVMTTI